MSKDKIIEFGGDYKPPKRETKEVIIELKKNQPRFDEIMTAIEEIKTFISDIEDSATFKVEPDSLTGSMLALTIVCTLLTVIETDKFCDTIKKADTIDITPLTTGDLQITFGFKNAFVLASEK